VRAHAHDLRVEVGESILADKLEADGWENAPLSNAETAMCAYAEKLTRDPASMSELDIQTLRDAGWQDHEIHDACQVIAYFNYINRIADGLGVDAEHDLPFSK